MTKIRRASSEHIAAVLNYVRANSLKTATEIAVAVKKCSITTVRVALADLVEKKLILKKSKHRFVAAEVSSVKVEPIKSKIEKTSVYEPIHPIMLWALDRNDHAGYITGKIKHTQWTKADI
jgi:predicted transcriptional regulator